MNLAFNKGRRLHAGMLVAVLAVSWAAKAFADDLFSWVDRANALSLKNHVAASRAIADALLVRLLTVDPDVRKKHADFARDAKDHGLAKLVNRGTIETEGKTRGGGAYFSVLTRSNSYDEMPQLELEHFQFVSGFHGGSAGLVAPLRATDVRRVAVSDCPAPLSTSYPDPIRALERQRGSDRYDAAVGKVFAVRWAGRGEGDVLAAFQVVARDEWTVTIAWRILEQFPTPPK